MKIWLRKILFKPVLWASDTFSSSPDKQRVFKALTGLHNCITEGDKTRGPAIAFDSTKEKIIIFSDQHKGARNGADDFMLCEPNYLAALDHYYEENYLFISLGDCEELWENSLAAVKKNQQPSFEKEKKFVQANRFIKTFGNHDLYWENNPFASAQLKDIYGCKVPVYEGVLLNTSVKGKNISIFCTHGHQGDKASDGNWFSKFFVANIWAPLQSLLKINPNTPAYDTQLKTLHNRIMYEWSSTQKDLLLITGHTHQPVFESLTYVERLYRSLSFARQVKDEEMIKKIEDEIKVKRFTDTGSSDEFLKLKPTYFNSGCCCFNDGDITGIEIEENCIRLIKWHSCDGKPQRMLLEEATLEELMKGKEQ